jgi:hypothetical protein
MREVALEASSRCSRAMRRRTRISRILFLVSRPHPIGDWATAPVLRATAVVSARRSCLIVPLGGAASPEALVRGVLLKTEKLTDRDCFGTDQ